MNLRWESESESESVFVFTELIPIPTIDSLSPVQGPNSRQCLDVLPAHDPAQSSSSLVLVLVLDQPFPRTRTKDENEHEA